MNVASFSNVTVSIACALTLALSVTDAQCAPSIVGMASVIDGDTIEIRGERIRLDVINAPESAQLCVDAGGKKYLCGQKSAFALADMIGRTVVSCDYLRKARHGQARPKTPPPIHEAAQKHNPISNGGCSIDTV